MQNKYNPDVLSCLANLSNDEVFTPPTIANQMLDMLPADLWSNPDAKFLDPCCKSGVFLREIAKRLIDGLAKKIPDLQERLNHIYSKQLYGIAITELTSMLSRRSVYCSKSANGKYSICDRFKNDKGNIAFDRTEHTWENGKCKFCGASQDVYDRDETLETYAYQFIHQDEVFKMKFDVIIGNPPYQLNVGVEQESYAIPLYHKFIQQAKRLDPRYLTMIVPSRWFAGGRGLDEFRDEMLHDDRIRIIHDFADAGDCFPGVEIKGGVCYFLWDRENRGKCSIFTHNGSEITSKTERPLLEPGNDTFIRYNEGISILNKVRKFKEASFADLVSPQTPFGIITSFKDYKTKPFQNSVNLYFAKGSGYITKGQIPKNTEMVDAFKIYITKSYGAGEGFPHQILNKPLFGYKNSCCTQTYLCIGPFNSKEETINAMVYISTRFFRFLVMLKKNTQDAMRGVYQFVPMQDFNEEWTDEKLYKKYKLTKDEIAFIESMIRPMELKND
ncbi:MAG: Eco57I restriction-modification methylase domain-containing protein [Alphaproteobacteria bacterium]|nr:Eco57I restriction-modification methylase domain-containing protein [Alphaproteobacteria bacterium]